MTCRLKICKLNHCEVPFCLINFIPRKSSVSTGKLILTLPHSCEFRMFSSSIFEKYPSYKACREIRVKKATMTNIPENNTICLKYFMKIEKCEIRELCQEYKTKGKGEKWSKIRLQLKNEYMAKFESLYLTDSYPSRTPWKILK